MEVWSLVLSGPQRAWAPKESPWAPQCQLMRPLSVSGRMELASVVWPILGDPLVSLVARSLREVDQVSSASETKSASALQREGQEPGATSQLQAGTRAPPTLHHGPTGAESTVFLPSVGDYH